MCASLQPWGQRRWPHQVRFRVGWCLVDLPHTEEALSISNSTLAAEPRGISTTPQIDKTDMVRVCVNVCMRVCTLLPWELKYRRVTLALPACLKQMSCWGLFHSNILTLPSWAPVISDVCSHTCQHWHTCRQKKGKGHERQEAERRESLHQKQDMENVNDCSSFQTDTYNTGRWDEMSFFSHYWDSFS